MGNYKAVKRGYNFCVGPSSRRVLVLDERKCRTEI